MTNVTDSSNLDNLQASQASPLANTDSSDKKDKSIKGAAVLLSTLNSALDSAEKGSKDPAPSAPLHFKDNSDCLMEVLNAGISMTGSIGTLMDATAASGVKTSEAASKASKFESDAITQYQKYGSTSGGMDMDFVDAGKSRNTYFKIVNGRFMMKKNDGPTTSWQDIGAATKDSSGHYEVPQAVKDMGYNFSGNNTKDWDAFTSSFDSGGTKEIQCSGPEDGWINGKGGLANATGANSGDMPIMMQQLQIMTATQNQVNSDMGNVAQIAGTSMQGETQAETLVQGVGSGAVQAAQGINQSINSLSQV